MKCGTTSLHKYLGKHPQVCVSSPKETNFLLEGNEKDIEWYHNCFEDDADAKAYGEFSTNYTKHPRFPGVPERMHELLPQVRLVYLVRDPIERAVSHYVHKWAEGQINDPINDVLQPVEESFHLNTSRYYYQLSQYLECYSREDMLVVQSERLRESREEVLKEIFRFIGVDAVHEDDAFTEEHNASSEKRRKGTIMALLTESTLGRVVLNVGKQFFPRSGVEWAKEVLSIDAQKPTMSKAVRLQAHEYLREDVERLRAFTGKEFPGWSL